jgi:hypothetical protein
MPTWLDITYAIGVANYHMQNPEKQHVEVIKMILQYVKGNIDYSILYQKDRVCQVTSYCDTDYVRDFSTKYFTSGYMFSLGSRVASLSTMKVRYRATTMAAQQSI